MCVCVCVCVCALICDGDGEVQSAMSICDAIASHHHVALIDARYPEHLGHAILYKASFVFKGLWYARNHRDACLDLSLACGVMHCVSFT